MIIAVESVSDLGPAVPGTPQVDSEFDWMAETIADQFMRHLQFRIGSRYIQHSVYAMQLPLG